MSFLQRFQCFFGCTPANKAPRSFDSSSYPNLLYSSHTFLCAMNIIQGSDRCGQCAGKCAVSVGGIYTHLYKKLILSLKQLELLLFQGKRDKENKQLLFALKRYIFFLYNIRSNAFFLYLPLSIKSWATSLIKKVSQIW